MAALLEVVTAQASLLMRNLLTWSHHPLLMVLLVPVARATWTWMRWMRLLLLLMNLRLGKVESHAGSDQNQSQVGGAVASGSHGVLQANPMYMVLGRVRAFSIAIHPVHGAQKALTWQATKMLIERTACAWCKTGSFKLVPSTVLGNTVTGTLASMKHHLPRL